MIYFKGINKYYGKNAVALKDVDLLIEEKSTTVILGEEGAGKSTLLRLINRLEEPSTGEIQVGGIDLSRVPVLSHRAKLGYVVRGAGLIPHRTLWQNVALVPRLQDLPKPRRTEEISKALALANIREEDFHKYPYTLSSVDCLKGAFARALVLNPTIVLCDEPFLGLEKKDKDAMRREFMRIRALSPNTAFVIATRDVVEAIKLSTVIVLMRNGSIVETGETKTIVRSPRTKYAEALFQKHKFQIRLEAINLRELMITDPVFVTTSQNSLPVSRAVYLMRKHRIGSLLVTDENKTLVGLIGIDEAQDGNPERRIGDIIKTDITPLRTTDSFSDALTFFVEHDIEFLPVTDEFNLLQGLITRKGISKFLEKLL